MSDDLSDYMEQNMREMGHPEYSEFAEAMRRMEGVSSVGWAYDDLYEIVFDPDASSGVVVRALKLATDHGYRPIEVESFHVRQNKIHVEGTHPPTTISIEWVRKKTPNQVREVGLETKSSIGFSRWRVLYLLSPPSLRYGWETPIWQLDSHSPREYN